MLIASSANNVKEAALDKEPEPTPEPTPTLPIPVYSEEAKERLKNIYQQSKKEVDGEEVEEKIAYLTFDDGPSSSVTPQILEILKREEVKATFFVLGSRVELYPELVKQAYEEGHYIANHGYSHNYKDIYSSTQAVLDEYNRTEEKIKSALGNENYSSYIFRFPGGSEGGKYKNLKNEAKGLLEDNDVLYINWNCLTNDSVGKPTYESLIKDFKLTQKREK
ncbi:MAG: polysaccharide deacetylase family protein [Clostridia bacterium]|nr:polysaccharide deacetylase family protein [Clostridia bacterium]